MLRAFTRDDAEEAHRQLDLDPEDPGMTWAERQAAVAYRATQLEWDEGIGSYAVTERGSGRIVGYAGLQFHLLPTEPLATTELELFYGIGRADRGRGYGFEATSALRDHAFGNLRVARLVSVTEKDNDRSVHLLQKLGARMEEHPTKPHLVLGVIERPGAAPGA